MEFKCYLIGLLDTRAKPPQLHDVVIASECAGSLTVDQGRYRAFDLFATRGCDYAEARDNMMVELRDKNFFRGQEWLRPFVTPELTDDM